MRSYLFKVELGEFINSPTESTHTDQVFDIHIQADSLSTANKIIEHRFGNYTRCRYYYKGIADEVS